MLVNKSPLATAIDANKIIVFMIFLCKDENYRSGKIVFNGHLEREQRRNDSRLARRGAELTEKKISVFLCFCVQYCCLIGSNGHFIREQRKIVQ